jgi:UDP-N-acetylmuramoyl-L-alanyl-D-glutamate--2,6-diaminopimelate ligase
MDYCHQLSFLLDSITPVERDTDITGLANDSRLVTKGDLFLAYKGLKDDGREYIKQAIDNGANAVCFSNEDGFEFQSSNTLILGVSNLKSHLGLICNRFYGKPSSKMDVVGVTGTNGKTTIAHMLSQANSLMGNQSAYIGTLGISLDNNQFKVTANTTPDALMSHKILADFNKKHISHVAFEVSSHALCQNRVDGIVFSKAIYTNLSHEHLDYHHTMDNYAKAKAKLFMYPNLKHAIINGDDSWSLEICDVVSHHCDLLTYGLSDKNDVYASSYQVNINGIKAHCITPWGEIDIQNNHLLGEFNLYNLLAILTCLCVEKSDLSWLSHVISQIKSVPGRMQVVAKNPTIIVDYAHTPDALENALATVNSLTDNRVIAVFGCGGDRDIQKRAIMGYVASKNSDELIITNDNPRSENPFDIALQIEQGIIDKHKAIIELDRKYAIEKAIEMASPQDVILIAGKGHENYQIIGSEHYEFCDAQIATQLHNRLCSS